MSDTSHYAKRCVDCSVLRLEYLEPLGDVSIHRAVERGSNTYTYSGSRTGFSSAIRDMSSNCILADMTGWKCDEKEADTPHGNMIVSHEEQCSGLFPTCWVAYVELPEHNARRVKARTSLIEFPETASQ